MLINIQTIHFYKPCKYKRSKIRSQDIEIKFIPFRLASMDGPGYFNRNRTSQIDTKPKSEVLIWFQKKLGIESKIETNWVRINSLYLNQNHGYPNKTDFFYIIFFQYIDLVKKYI